MDYNFNSPNIKGLYCNNTVAINKSISTQAEKSCVLAEELGHHYTTVGDIIDQTKASNRKQEYRARLYGYKDVYKRQVLIPQCNQLTGSPSLLSGAWNYITRCIYQHQNLLIPQPCPGCLRLLLPPGNHKHLGDPGTSGWSLPAAEIPQFFYPCSISASPGQFLPGMDPAQYLSLIHI